MLNPLREPLGDRTAFVPARAVPQLEAGHAQALELAFVLARLVTRDAPASLTAGVFYAFVSFKFDHLAHVQVIASGWIPPGIPGFDEAELAMALAGIRCTAAAEIAALHAF